MNLDDYRALDIARHLMRQPSVTPEDEGCQDYLEQVLTPLGFTRIRIDLGGVTNSVFQRPGERKGNLAFAGHTDVVPTGPVDQWKFPPFEAALDQEILHGRGAQDMKAAIACWVEAVAHLCLAGDALPTLQLLITSDEEGDSIDGTIRIVEYLQQHRQLPDASIVGEPSSSQQVGDTIRRGRRGVVQIQLQFKGIQGHSAYPQDANNAIHLAAPALANIAALNWGVPAEGFPSTTCQITNISGGTGASNVIPGSCEAFLDIRYNPANNFEEICNMIEKACEGSNCTMLPDHVAQAFSTPDCRFLNQVCDAIEKKMGIQTIRDTGGGTSDARFLAAAGVPVAELGLTNDTIHQINERVAVSELEQLTSIYQYIIQNFEV